MPCVHHEHCGEIAIAREQRRGQRVEFLRRLPAAPGVAVPRQVYQVKRLRGSTRNAVQIREPRLAGRRARARQALANQRVDQARFADVRSSDERDPREAVVGNIARGGRASNECGFDSQ